MNIVKCTNNQLDSLSLSDFSPSFPPLPLPPPPPRDESKPPHPSGIRTAKTLCQFETGAPPAERPPLVLPSLGKEKKWKQS